MEIRLTILFAYLLTWIDPSAAIHHKHYHHRAPIIDLNGAEELLGIIREDEKVVTVTPTINILKGTGPVCRYELTPIEETKEMPFEARILDNALGTVEIRLRDEAQAEIDCSDVEYKIRVVAVRCADDSAKSDPVTLRVTIQDVNNHVPEFDAPWYTFDVEEGKTMEITRLIATDKDCGHPYGKVCRYELVNNPEKSPFRIDDQGILRIIKPLNHSQEDSHILTVVAYDCGMLRSKSTLVTVHVKPRCIDGIRQGSLANEQLEITSGESKTVFPNVELASCGHCNILNAEAQVKLEDVKNISPQECGLDNGAIELLKMMNQTEVVDDDEEEFEEGLSEEESTNNVATFDGKTTFIDIDSKVKKVIPEKFTLYFSMKTTPGSQEEQKEKQNILCETDANGLNRHHFAVYIRHCKLELLLRREPANAEANFRAAEWRWSDSRICDGTWHSYGIIFSDLDNVALLVDGELFNTTERNPEILDDWPLHEHKDKKTKSTVGACWHGRSQKMVQFFKGQLAKMYLTVGKAESKDKLSCLHKEHERLILNDNKGILKEEKGSKQLVLKTKTLDDLSLLLQSIQYSSNGLITEGLRSISITGAITCQGEGIGKEQKRHFLPQKRIIKVKAPTTPKFSIIISGQSLINSDRKSLKNGATLLPDIQITINDEAKSSADIPRANKLDWCWVHMTPARDMDLEFFSSPATLMASLNVDFVHDKQGIMLKGKETPENYAKILMKIHYFNTRPESYKKRVYKLQCGEDNVVSNEFLITMEIKNDDDEFKEAIEKIVTHRLDEEIEATPSMKTEDDKKERDEQLTRMVKHFEPQFDQLGANRLQNVLEMDLPRPKALHGYETGQTAVAGGAIAVAVVICIGMLLILLVVGVVKMRDEPILQKRRDSLLEWDDNGLNMNLTMNPLEGFDKKDQQIVYDTNEIDGSEGSEDGESYRDDMSDDDDNVVEGMPLKADNGQTGLEWDDDEALNPNPKSYCV